MKFYMLWDIDRGTYQSRSWRTFRTYIDDNGQRQYEHGTDYSPRPRIYATVGDAKNGGKFPSGISNKSREELEKWWNEHYEIREFEANDYVVRGRFD